MDDNNIVNQNADEQAPDTVEQPQPEATATTNEPADVQTETAPEQPEAAANEPIAENKPDTSAVKIEEPVKETVAAQPQWSTNVANLLPGTYFINVYNNANKTFIGRAAFIKL